MKQLFRDIAFGIALSLILAGLWILFGLGFALLAFGVLLLALLIRGVMFPPDKKSGR